MLGRSVRSMIKLLEVNPQGPYTTSEQRTLKRGKRARDRMMTANIRLVAMVVGKAAKSRSRGMRIDHEDLVAEGMFGLLRAIEKFDPDRGYKLSTYAFWWIRQTVAREIHYRGRLIRMPAHLCEKFERLNLVRNKLAMKLGRPATRQEIADDLGLTLDDLEYGLTIGGSAQSLNASVLDDGSELIETITDGKSVGYDLVEADMQLDALREGMEKLDEGDRKLLAMRFGFDGHEPQVYEKIAQEHGYSRERARQKIEVAARKLKLQVSASVA